MSVTNLTKEERETIVVWSEADDIVRISTSSPAQLRRLRADERFREEPCRYADGLSGEFSIPVSEFNLVKAAKRRMSSEERERRGASLRQGATK